MDTDRILPVILAGGAGTRLWPHSRRLLPKQFRALGDMRPPLGQTLERVADAQRFAPPIIVCGPEVRFHVLEQIDAAGLSGAEVVVEPRARGSAAAACAGALRALANGACEDLLILPADMLLHRPADFYGALDRATAAAGQGWLAMFAEPATADGTGRWGVETGPALPGLSGCSPALTAAPAGACATASVLCEGALVARAPALLGVFEDAAPDILHVCEDALARGDERAGMVTLAESELPPSRHLELDAFLREQLDRVAIVHANMGWVNLDTWAQVWAESAKDNHGNATAGEVIPFDTHDCLLHSDGRLLTTLGLADMAVVVTDDAVLICPRDRAGEVGALAQGLAEAGHAVAAHHTRVFRPWGSYKGVHNGAGFQVKELTVEPGSVLSLQRHRYRAEHWVVVSGTAEVTCDDRIFRLEPNQSTFVPLGAVHRLANPGTDVLRVIEVQYGSYLGEDDIERIEDVYGRMAGA